MWGTMHKLLSIIWKSLSAVGYLTFVLFLVLYIFAVLGEYKVFEYKSKFGNRSVFNTCTALGSTSIATFLYSIFYAKQHAVQLRKLIKLH